MIIDLQTVQVSFGSDDYFEAYLPMPYPRKADSIVSPYFSKAQLDAIALWCKGMDYYAAFDEENQSFTICPIRYTGDHLEREGFVKHAFETYFPEVVGRYEGQEMSLYAFAWHWGWMCSPQ